MRHGVFTAGAAGFALLVAACDLPPSDETFVVNVLTDTIDANPGDGNCADSGGNCSLRAAVMEGNADPNTTEIHLAGGSTYTLTIPGANEDASATGDLDTTASTYIRAVGGGVATVDGNGLDRVFDIRDGGLHALEDLVITGGSAEEGGGVRHAHGILDLRARVTGNTASFGGGGVWTETNVLSYLDRATVDGNTAGDYGGGIYSWGTLTLRQTTVSGNSAGELGGGVTTEAGSVTGVSYSTITDNTGGGLDVFGGTTTLEASVVGDQTTGDDCTVASAGSIVTNGYNADSDATCGLTGPGDQSGGMSGSDLGSLTFNGGPFPNHLPTAGSSLRNRVPDGTLDCGSGDLSVDPNGTSRPAGTHCDTGAVERP